MGDIAEMILDGILDECTGEYIGPGVGYPRSLDPSHYSNKTRAHRNPYGGIQKWMMMNTTIKKPGAVWRAIRKYCETHPVTEPDKERGKAPYTLAKWIQDNRWKEFMEWVIGNYTIQDNDHRTDAEKEIARIRKEIAIDVKSGTDINEARRKANLKYGKWWREEGLVTNREY